MWLWITSTYPEVQPGSEHHSPLAQEQQQCIAVYFIPSYFVELYTYSPSLSSCNERIKGIGEGGGGTILNKSGTFPMSRSPFPCMYDSLLAKSVFCSKIKVYAQSLKGGMRTDTCINPLPPPTPLKKMIVIGMVGVRGCLWADQLFFSQSKCDDKWVAPH